MTINRQKTNHTNHRNLLIERFSYKQNQNYTVPSSLLMNNSNFIDVMLLTEEFVAGVLKNDEPAWIMPKTQTRYLEQRLTKTGEAFYALVQPNLLLVELPHHQLGVNQQLFNRITNEMELSVNQLRKQASFQANPTGPLEGEYVNALIERIRKEGNTQKFKDRSKERQKDARRHPQQAKKLIKALSEKVRFLCGHKIVLESRESGCFPASTNPLESNAHLNNFRDGLQELSHEVRSVGQFWSREYLPETGFRIRMVLLYEPRTLDEIHHDWCNPLQSLWLRATNGSGKFTLHPISMGTDEISQELKAHELADTVACLASESWNNFGYFDSYAMSVSGLRMLL